ncbi:outer dense fiber protein 3-B-like [Macrosteles quadrilineatus]|uniref:outer dense fiber protein 3-B-like n=1 Tax=Macrosteles quadrilineatus TaxID=74068 RepID=UPI0023E273D7|nr:outer dense fiber protein 3-B-like [Macrosteles quadrilineatus]
MVRVHGPGPKYALPSTIGAGQLDPTLAQAPAFSFGVRTVGYGRVRVKAPGPKYDTRGFTQHGKLTTQETSMLDRWKSSRLGRTPGPKYDNSTKLVEPSPPAYSFGNKRADLRKSKVGPGPNKYAPPTSIGPSIPDLKAEPAFSILGRNFFKTKQLTPGPKYMLPENNVYLKTPPSVPILGRPHQKYKSGTPGPKYNPIPTYEKREALKGISFGVQHSPEKHLVYLPEDKAQDTFVF